MDYKYIIVEKKEHITIVRINRPEVRNALNPYVSIELENVFRWCISLNSIATAVNVNLYLVHWNEFLPSMSRFHHLRVRVIGWTTPCPPR